MVRYECNNPHCLSVKAGRDEVIGVKGKFDHPDLGRQDGVVCPYCGKPVMIKDDKIPA